ncbi:stress responsive alpha/beta barrel protein [Flavobacterium araucananum]|uniref:Stress responsive protein n=1 Tax=Flavobacterium araucananum TaxID=946678 RepID=A0A227P734_9FLAO|nr:Dabb family protein [Flavobacterium araucananum]OXG05058.1 stress responsive protein [Flavobacterium araucananum]PWJ96772.1 stress responsive alpha/beta barrel protein [Flavobacterium araucananum]
MIYHTIRVGFLKEVTEEQKQEVALKFHQMGNEIKSVNFYGVGKDIGGEFEMGAIFALNNIEDYKDYMHNPIHRQMDSLGLPLVKNMISQDLTDDPDPQIKNKIEEIHAKRFENDKELSLLVKGLSSYKGSGIPK